MTLVRWVCFCVFFAPWGCLSRVFSPVSPLALTALIRSASASEPPECLTSPSASSHDCLTHTAGPRPCFCCSFLSFHCHSLVPSSFTSLPHLLLQIALPHSSYPKFPAPTAQRESVKTGCCRLSRLSPPPHPFCLTLTIAFQPLCPPHHRRLLKSLTFSSPRPPSPTAFLEASLRPHF